MRDKKEEIALKKQVFPQGFFERFPLFERQSPSLSTALREKGLGIIAEHKRRSPSRAVINNSLRVWEVAEGYEQAGACGMSVLTDGKHFGGSLDDLLAARAASRLPLLRKDFTIDEYQILEAKAYGADVILLIAAILSTDQIRSFSTLASSLGLEVLLEVHDREELDRSLFPGIQMVGVNNRNLKTFEVDLDTSRSLAAHIPEEFVRVSESGISKESAIKDLNGYGYQGFLIGENFMKTQAPGRAAREFINNIQK